MYKHFKYKFYSTLFLVFFFISNLYAKEPLMATLVNIHSNDTQEFKINKSRFSCSPYGVITIDRLFTESKADSVCRKSISAFYTKRKDLQYYVHGIFNIYQLYNLKFEDEKCIINVSGEKSLSEILLDKGLAIKKPGALHREYDFYLYKAERKARIQKRGLWGENIFQECASYIYVK